MVEYLICDYLTEKGAITAVQAEEALEKFRKGDIKLGAIALNEKLLTENQIARIHEMQKNVDKKFGEIAVEQKDMSEEELVALIKKQRECVAGILDILVAEGYMSKEKLDEEIENLKRDFDITDDEMKLVMNDDVDMIASLLINTGDFYTNYYLSIALKFITRFLGNKNRIGRTKKVSGYECERAVMQKICTQKSNYAIGFAGTRDALHTLTDSLESFEASNGIDGRYLQLVGFINCISCIFECGIMRESEINSHSKAKLYKSAEIDFRENGFVLPVTLRGTDIDIIVASGVNDDFVKIVHNI